MLELKLLLVTIAPAADATLTASNAVICVFDHSPAVAHEELAELACRVMKLDEPGLRFPLAS